MITATISPLLCNVNNPIFQICISKMFLQIKHELDKFYIMPNWHCIRRNYNSAKNRNSSRSTS